MPTKLIVALIFAALTATGFGAVGYEMYSAAKHQTALAAALSVAQAEASQARADAAAAASDAAAVRAAYAAQQTAQRAATATATAAHTNLANAAKSAPVASEIVPDSMWAAIQGNVHESN
jgi:hypothetical protein